MLGSSFPSSPPEPCCGPPVWCEPWGGGSLPAHYHDPVKQWRARDNWCMPAGPVGRVGNSLSRGHRASSWRGPQRAGPVPTPAAWLPRFVPALWETAMFAFCVCLRRFSIPRTGVWLGQTTFQRAAEPGEAAMWSCGLLNGTGQGEEQLCQDLRLGLWVLSLLHLVAGVPVGLGYNALLVVANLSNKSSMTMPDVYFVNMAVSGLVLTALAPVHLLGPPYSSHVSSRITECAKMQNTEAADTLLVLIGYIVPGLAVLYALVLISRIRKEDTPLDQEAGRLDPSVHRLLVATVCTQFGLWTPYYLSLLGHMVLVSRGRPIDGHYLGILHFAKDLSKFLAFVSSSVTPLLYRYINKNFPSKLRRLIKKMHCGQRRCSLDPAGVQQVMAQA
ncbi:probable G-protein coupled receptor 146 isoform X3 [Marmota monax]|nr:probable G-protein coupled receptor 146 isoform X3 [Marmota monax]